MKKGQVAPAKLRSAAYKHYLLIIRHNTISYTIKKFTADGLIQFFNKTSDNEFSDNRAMLS